MLELGRWVELMSLGALVRVAIICGAMSLLILFGIYLFIVWCGRSLPVVVVINAILETCLANILGCCFAKVTIDMLFIEWLIRMILFFGVMVLMTWVRLFLSWLIVVCLWSERCECLCECWL